MYCWAILRLQSGFTNVQRLEVEEVLTALLQGDLEIAERLYLTAHRYSSESSQRSFRMNRVSYLLRARRFREASLLFR